MSTRRWPIITLALILVNLLIFAGTHRTVDQQDSQLWKVQEHILILAATHPSLVPTPEATAFLAGFQIQFPDDWAELFSLAMLWASGKLSLSVEKINALFRRLAMPGVKAALR